MSSSSTPTTPGADDEERTQPTLIDSSGMVYRAVRELGEGGTARAVLAYGVGASGFSKLVVLKMLHKQLAMDPSAREMFEAEARLSARLNHPNLVQVYDVVDAEIPFLVMEYLDGKPLSAVLTGTALTQAMRLTIVSEALVGLHHAHELCDFAGAPLNIVHRDISPHNVFVTYDGAVKVLDFGLAKAAGNASRTETGEVKGKLAYMAPEQLLGQPVDRRTDIFAAGCIIWEAAVGRRIWGEMTDAAVMHRLATGQIPRPDGKTGMDPRLEHIVTKATATAREERYATALDLQRDLSAYVTRRWGACSVRDAGAALAQAFSEERERNREILGSAISNSGLGQDAGGGRSKSGSRSAATTGPRWRRWLVGGALLGLPLAALGVWYLSAKTPPASAISAPDRPALVHVRVRVMPPEASIDIDGVDRGPGPLSLEVAGGGQEHSIRARAAGYVPETRTLSLTQDTEIEFALEKIAPQVQAPPAHPSATATTPANDVPRHAGVFVPKPKTAPSATTESGCNPPYYFSGGIKTFKPECL
ncbi:MAG TPA: serine/threonine-protein kinase [Polyangiaceae bacterium]|jgi:serine/threonine-protein kinase